MMTQLRISRLLTSSLNKRLISTSLNVQNTSNSAASCNPKFLNLYPTNILVSKTTPYRSLSTSNILLQKKEDDDDDDKKKDKKKSKQDEEVEEKYEKIKENWEKLSAFGRGFVAFLGLGLLVNIFSFASQNSSSLQDGLIEETDMTTLTKLLSENSAANLTHDSRKNRLEYKNTKNLRTEYIDNVDILTIRTHIDRLYENLGIAYSDRQIISVKKTQDSGMESIALWFRTLFSEHFLTIALVAYFAIYLRLKGGQGGGLFQQLNAQAQKNSQNAKGKSKGKGKKGKKDDKSNNPFGGMFGNMQPNQEIGTLIEAEDLDTGFRHVAGCEEAKIEVIEIVDFLKNKHKYQRMGAEVPKGAIFHGPPGTGKTLLAKACAKEANVSFIQCSGSDFIEMYVGLGSKRVRSLFEMARDNAPSILFIDEIDSIGSKRGGGGQGGGATEHNQTINSILAEMDGFNTGKVPVVVMAATNRLDTLDDALMRPGRFDRKIYIGSPDVEGRKKIFNVHLDKIHTKDDKEELAKWLSTKTPGMSGAEIKNVCNEAALHAVRNGDEKIVKFNFEKAIDRTIAGLEKQNSLLDPKVKRRIAVHEAGHATTSWFLEHCMPLVKVTITPRTGGALGFAMYQPDSSSVLHTAEQYKHNMISTLAGRAAEEVFYGDVSSGAHDDLKKVTKQAYQIIATLGMGEKIRNVNYHDAANEMQAGAVFPSQATREVMDEEIQKLIDEQYERALDLVRAKKDLIEAMSEKLMEKETLVREDVIEILGERPFEDKMTYEAQTAASKQADQEFELPPGLKHWEKSFRYKKGEDDDLSDTSKAARQRTASADLSNYELPEGWEEKYSSESGSYFLNEAESCTCLRHPGKPLPPKWKTKIDEEGRMLYEHESGQESWSLEEDDNLSPEIKEEIKKWEEEISKDE